MDVKEFEKWLKEEIEKFRKEWEEESEKDSKLWPESLDKEDWEEQFVYHMKWNGF